MEQPVPSVFDEMEQYKPINYAPRELRFLNFIIDSIVLWGLVFVMTFVLVFIDSFLETGFTYFIEAEDIGSNALRNLLTTVIAIITYSLIEGISKGRTLGKLITGTQAVQKVGSLITWRQAFLRSLCRYIPFEPFSVFSGNGMRHDRFSKTIVVKTRGV